MDAKQKAEVRAIIEELNRIIKDINNTANDLSTFKGIGTEFCVRKLNSIASRYSGLINKLNHL